MSLCQHHAIFCLQLFICCCYLYQRLFFCCWCCCCYLSTTVVVAKHTQYPTTAVYTLLISNNGRVHDVHIQQRPCTRCCLVTLFFVCIHSCQVLLSVRASVRAKHQSDWTTRAAGSVVVGTFDLMSESR